MTIKETLAWGTRKLLTAKTDSAHLDAEILLLYALFTTTKKESFQKIQQRTRSWLVTHGDNTSTSETLTQYTAYIERRMENEPLAYITHKKYFYGLEFYVDERVLIPRPETELIVEEVVRTLLKIADGYTRILLIDIGTGSGCIPISILKELQVTEHGAPVTYCTDISSNALEIAKYNAKKYHILNKITFLQGNLLEPVINMDCLKNTDHVIITANLPYLPYAQYRKPSHKEIHFEPRTALESGKTGIKHYSKLFKQLATTSVDYPVTLIIEHDPRQVYQLKKEVHTSLPKAHIKNIKDASNKNRIMTIRYNETEEKK